MFVCLLACVGARGRGLVVCATCSASRLSRTAAWWACLSCSCSLCKRHRPALVRPPSAQRCAHGRLVRCAAGRRLQRAKRRLCGLRLILRLERRLRELPRHNTAPHHQRLPPMRKQLLGCARVGRVRVRMDFFWGACVPRVCVRARPGGGDGDGRAGEACCCSASIRSRNLSASERSCSCSCCACMRSGPRESAHWLCILLHERPCVPLPSCAGAHQQQMRTMQPTGRAYPYAGGRHALIRWDSAALGAILCGRLRPWQFWCERAAPTGCSIVRGSVGMPGLRTRPHAAPHHVRPSPSLHTCCSPAGRAESHERSQSAAPDSSHTPVVPTGSAYVSHYGVRSERSTASALRA